MKPTSFLFEDTRTPQCHWGSQPGGRRALGGGQGTGDGGGQERVNPSVDTRQLKVQGGNQNRGGGSPFEKVWRIVESEHVVVVLHVVLVQ